jgi:hypothetical protein
VVGAARLNRKKGAVTQGKVKELCKIKCLEVAVYTDEILGGCVVYLRVCMYVCIGFKTVVRNRESGLTH